MSKKIASKNVKLKRAYETPSTEDGIRVLVDRLWPRGVKRSDAAIDHWFRELSPSTELRKWFSHDITKWPEFRRLYKGELAERADLVKRLVEDAKKGTITLLFAAKDTEHVNAAVLKEVIEKSMTGAEGNKMTQQKPRKRQRHSRLRIREQEI
jgi:uncharacterized protein YeaO (DUF488 family)